MGRRCRRHGSAATVDRLARDRPLAPRGPPEVGDPQGQAPGRTRRYVDPAWRHDRGVHTAGQSDDEWLDGRLTDRVVRDTLLVVEHRREPVPTRFLRRGDADRQVLAVDLERGRRHDVAESFGGDEPEVRRRVGVGRRRLRRVQRVPPDAGLDPFG